jgi:hypothetical protein
LRRRRRLDLGVDRAAHLLDRLAEREAGDRLVVDVGDQVAGLDPGLEGRGLVDRGDDLHEAVLHRDLDPEPAELAPRLHLHVAVAVGVEVARVRVERAQHPVDGRLDQLLVRGLLDVLGADALEHVAEQLQVTERVAGRLDAAGERAEGGAGGERRDGDEAEPQRNLAHQPRTLSSREASQPAGSTGVPRWRSST